MWRLPCVFHSLVPSSYEVDEKGYRGRSPKYSSSSIDALPDISQFFPLLSPSGLWWQYRQASCADCKGPMETRGLVFEFSLPMEGIWFPYTAFILDGVLWCRACHLVQPVCQAAMDGDHVQPLYDFTTNKRLGVMDTFKPRLPPGWQRVRNHVLRLFQSLFWLPSELLGFSGKKAYRHLLDTHRKLQGATHQPKSME